MTATIKPKMRRMSTTLKSAVLDISAIEDKKPLLGRKTKIICTIGPATKEVPMLCEMLKVGMNVARLNFSHGTHEYHKQVIENVREATKITQIPCAVLLDTKGPEIRTGKLKGGKPVVLKANSEISIHCAPGADFEGTTSDISVDFGRMPQVVKKGTVVKIDDGLIIIEVTEVKDQVVKGIVLNNQTLGERKGVNLPGIDTGLPAMTEKDKADILFGVENRVDIIAPSFINSADDILKIREILGEKGAYIKIISKIESVKGLDNFDEILRVSDGIMVARGDLGVEIPIQKVCMAQKTMINKCNALGKPIVTATQMLDSMIKNPNPTRAEAADVANAVFDGSDCVMLSGETANGKYPINAVSIMAKICRRSESCIDYDFAIKRINAISNKAVCTMNIRTESITASAVKIAIEMKAALIFALSDSGRTARFVSKYMSPLPIVVVTPNQVTSRQVLISKGLWPLSVDEKLTDDDRLLAAKKVALEQGWCSEGDCVVVISGRYDVSGSSYQIRVLDVTAITE